MLTDLKLPHRFLAEALSTAVYLWNRSPTKPLERINPYEACSGTKPDVIFLCIFGCSAYTHVPKTERCKFDSKTRRCVLLGYGTSQKGYHLCDLEHTKVINSRDVVFDETSMPGTQKEKEPTVKHVELEIEEEPIEETATPNPPDSVPEEIPVHEKESPASDLIVSESDKYKTTARQVQLQLYDGVN